MQNAKRAGARRDDFSIAAEEAAGAGGSQGAGESLDGWLDWLA
jgi:hypothetical protein